MTTRATRWVMMISCTLAALTAAGAAFAESGVRKFSFQPEHFTMTGATVPGSGTMLVRTNEFVYATVHTSGLNPGWAYTAWFAFFNKPEHCATNPCTPADLSNPAVQGSLVNFGGRIVGDDGVASFAEVRAVGDASSAFSGPGLLFPRRAEIHLAVRSHGPADPALFPDQLTMFNGGCPPNTCMTVQAAVHQR